MVRLPDTVPFDLDAPVDLTAASFTRLPKGEAIMIRPPLGSDFEFKLSKHVFTFRHRTPIEVVDEHGKAHAVAAGKNILGRDTVCNVVVGSGMRDVSRMHLIVEPIGDGSIRFTDLSSHGTFLPKEPLDYEPVFIATGTGLALIVFGATLWFGVRALGPRAYLATFARPSILLAPLNIVELFTRSFSLMVRLFGKMRQVLAELDAGDRGGDRVELAANVRHRVGLHVPHVEVAGTAVEEDDDAGVGPGLLLAPGVGAEQAGQAEVHEASAADLQHLSAGQRHGPGAGGRDHGGAPTGRVAVADVRQADDWQINPAGWRCQTLLGVKPTEPDA